MALRLKAYINIDGKESHIEASGDDVPSAMAQVAQALRDAWTEQPKPKAPHRPHRQKGTK